MATKNTERTLPAALEAYQKQQATLETKKQAAIDDCKQQIRALELDLAFYNGLLSDLTGKPAEASTGAKKNRMKKEEVEAAKAKLLEIMPRTKATAKSSTDIMKEMNLPKTAWQTLTKPIADKLKKVGDKSTAVWYMAA